MKKIFLFLLFFVQSTLAASADWKLDPVLDKDKQPIGYVYHTESLATVGNEKIAASLRLVCSIKTNKSDPVILVYLNHNRPSEVIYTSVDVSIDNRPVDNTNYWFQHNNIVYRYFLDSAALIELMKSSKTIKIRWVDKNLTRYQTMFALDSFDAEFSNFLRNCKI